MFSTLITPDQLRERLNEPDWVIVDCRFDLTAPAAGEQAFGIRDSGFSPLPVAGEVALRAGEGRGRAARG